MERICKNCALCERVTYPAGRGLLTQYRCQAAGDGWMFTDPYSTCESFETVGQSPKEAERIVNGIARYFNAKVLFIWGDEVLDGTLAGIAAGDQKGMFIITRGRHRYAVPYRDVRISGN